MLDYKLLHRLVKEVLDDLSESYPFFIPCDVFRRRLESKMANAVLVSIDYSFKRLISDRISDSGLKALTEPQYSLEFEPLVVSMLAEQWKVALNIAADYGLEKQTWNDKDVFRRSDNSELYNSLLSIFAVHDSISFYGGKLQNKKQPKDSIVHNSFSYVLRGSLKVFELDQLQYFADSIGGRIERQLFSDDLSYLECVGIVASSES